MARGRLGTATKNKLGIVCYAPHFCGKSTLASQFLYMHNEDGSPMKVLYIDCESGSIDYYLDEIEANGWNTKELLLIYSQSLAEVLSFIDRVKNNEDFYTFDEDTGEETDEVFLDAKGNPWRPDAIVIDGITVLHQSVQAGLIEFSKKRARVKADDAQLTGDAKLVKVEGAGLEIKDRGTIKQKGSSLILSLLATGVHWMVTARATDEKKSVKTADGQITSVPTGKIVPEGWVDLSYNCHTLIRLEREDDGEIVAHVEKDRSGVHPYEDVYNPSLLDWQVVIDKSKNKKDFVIKNDLDSAIVTEQEMYAREVMGRASKPLTKEDLEKELEGNTTETRTPKEIITEINGLLKSVALPEKQAIRAKVKEAGLPDSFARVTDAEVLNKILEIVKANI